MEDIICIRSCMVGITRFLLTTKARSKGSGHFSSANSTQKKEKYVSVYEVVIKGLRTNPPACIVINYSRDIITSAYLFMLL